MLETESAQEKSSKQGGLTVRLVADGQVVLRFESWASS